MGSAVPANSQKGRPAVSAVCGTGRAPNHFKAQSSIMNISALAMVSANEQNKEERQKVQYLDDLEERLKHFYHWRLALMVFVQKFSTVLDNKRRLYFGMNRKMILDPSPTLSCYGPISTTPSYYVARNFASEQGMILEISSMYPRLGMCHAFNASLMSEYPEEQEYLIGHIYMRINRISIKEPGQYLPVNSKLRLAFFAIHLFQRQIFSMGEYLEHILDAFLCLQVFNCASNNNNNARDLFASVLKKDRSPFYQFLSAIFECKKKKQPLKVMPPGVIKMEEKEKERKNHIFYILIKKFHDFCVSPNRRQIVKIDCISEGLKPYFLDEDEKWIVSFDKVLFLYPNLKQIHFLNLYKFDNAALEKLIAAVQRKDCQLEKIKFLYCVHSGSLSDYEHFYDPDSLDNKLMNQLNDLKWKVSYERNEKTKFVINIKKRN